MKRECRTCAHGREKFRDNSLSCRCPECMGWPEYRNWSPAHPLPLPEGVSFRWFNAKDIGYRVPPARAAEFARGLR